MRYIFNKKVLIILAILGSFSVAMAARARIIQWKGTVVGFVSGGETLVIRRIFADKKYPLFFADFADRGSHYEWDGKKVVVSGTSNGIDCEAYSRTILSGGCAPWIGIRTIH